MQNLQENKNTISLDHVGDHPRGGNSPTSQSIKHQKPTTPSTKHPPLKDNELINCGLHKLVSSFSIANKLNQRPPKIVYNKKSENDEPSSKRNSSPGRKVMSSNASSQQMLSNKHTMTDMNKHTMTEFDEAKPIRNDEPYKDLQWTSAKLIKKNSQKRKKCQTVPQIDESDYASDISDESDDEKCNRNLKNTKPNLLLKCLYYFCTTSISFVGSMCGIILITMVLWKVLDENVLSFYFDPPKQETYLDMFKSALSSVTNIF